MPTKSTEIKNLDSNAIAEANKRVLDDDSLRNIKSLDDAFAALSEQGVIPESFADYGTGFDVLDADNKDRLVKMPFVILEWTFNKGDFGEYVAAMVVTKSGEKCVLIDGGTGIRQQLSDVTASRIRNGKGLPQQGLLVEKGLRRSDYTYVDKDGESRPATTYYLAQ